MFLVVRCEQRVYPVPGAQASSPAGLPLTYPREVYVWLSLCMAIWNLTALS